MSDDIQRRGLVADLTRRLALASVTELRAVDAMLTALEQVRAGIDKDRWERRLPTGAGDFDRVFHLARAVPSRGVVETLCRGSWPLADMVETQANPELTERCSGCLREAADHPLAVALVELGERMRLEDEERAELREAARREMFEIAERDRIAVLRDQYRHTPLVAEQLRQVAEHEQAIEAVAAAREFEVGEPTRASIEPARLALDDDAGPYAAVELGGEGG